MMGFGRFSRMNLEDDHALIHFRYPNNCTHSFSFLYLLITHFRLPDANYGISST